MAQGPAGTMQQSQDLNPVPLTPTPTRHCLHRCQEKAQWQQTRDIHGPRGGEREMSKTQRAAQPHFPKNKNEYSQGDPESLGDASLRPSEPGWEGGAHEALGKPAVPDDGHMRGPQEPG